MASLTSLLEGTSSNEIFKACPFSPEGKNFLEILPSETNSSFGSELFFNLSNYKGNSFKTLASTEQWSYRLDQLSQKIRFSGSNKQENNI